MSGIQPLQNLTVLEKHGMEHKMEWAGWAINKGFAGAIASSHRACCVITCMDDIIAALETLLAQCAGQYCVGDQVCCVYIEPVVCGVDENVNVT